MHKDLNALARIGRIMALRHLEHRKDEQAVAHDLDCAPYAEACVMFKSSRSASMRLIHSI